MDNNQIIQNIDADMHFKHITYEEKVKKGYEELLNTKTEEVIDW